MGLPLQPPLAPMLAKLARTIPTGDGWAFEPKWDGFRCIVFRHGDEVTLTSRNERPFNRYFPELLAPLAEALPDRAVVDGEIVIPAGVDGAAGLDFDALLSRLHPAASRVALLAAQTPASFVAFDLLALGERSLMDAPFAERRSLLENWTSVVVHGPVGVHLTPITHETATATRWFHQFEGAGLDGIVAKDVDGPYQPGKRAWVKVKHERQGEVLVVGYRVHQDGAGVGSLVLALGGPDGLHHVGVASGFTAARRAELLAELSPLSGGQTADASGAGSRWNVGKDLSFVALRDPRVARVAFGQLQGHRFRHGVRLIEWLDGADPSACRLDQLDVAAPVPFLRLVAEGSGGSV